MLYCIFLDCTFVDLESAAACLVGYGHDSYDVVAALYEFVKRCYSKLRRTHVHDTRLLEVSHYLCFDFLESVLETFRTEDCGVVDCLPGEEESGREEDIAGEEHSEEWSYSAVSGQFRS